MAANNPFILIRDTFESAYKPGSSITVGAAPDGQEFIGGRLPDGGELGLYRLGVSFIDGGSETFRVQIAPDMPTVLPPEDEEVIHETMDEATREYLVGGGEGAPIGCEVTCTDPLETRLLEPYEMIDLAQKIGSTTFRAIPTQ